MKKQIFNEMIKVTDLINGDFYNHICKFCNKTNKNLEQFQCNTSRGLVCESKDIHYCTACKEAACFFHSTMIININYCYNCTNEMTRHQEKKFE